MSRAILEEAMKVQACALVAKIIVKIDHNVVTHVHLNQWYGPFSIDANYTPLHHAVRVRHDP